MPAPQYKDPVSIDALLGRKKPAAKSGATSTSTSTSASSVTTSARSAGTLGRSSGSAATKSAAKPASRTTGTKVKEALGVDALLHKKKPAAASPKASAAAEAGKQKPAEDKPKAQEQPAQEPEEDLTGKCAQCKGPYAKGEAMLEMQAPGAPKAVVVHPGCQEAYILAKWPKCAHCEKTALEGVIRATLKDEHDEDVTVVLHDACSDAFEAAMKEKRKASRVEAAKAKVKATVAGVMPAPQQKPLVKKNTLCAHCKKRNATQAMVELAGVWGVAALHTTCVDGFKRANARRASGDAVRSATGATAKCAACKKAFRVDEVPGFARESLLGTNPHGTKMLEVHMHCRQRLLEEEAAREAQ